MNFNDFLYAFSVVCGCLGFSSGAIWFYLILRG